LRDIEIVGASKWCSRTKDKMRSFTSFYFPFSRKKKKVGWKKWKNQENKRPPKKERN
jgi:hypothetical protein